MKTIPELNSLILYFETFRDEILNDYYKFLSFQSISSEPQYQDQLLACVDWLKTFLKEMGLNVEIWKTEGHPTIFASYKHNDPTKPTLLIYNHYDVQPVDPLDLWISDPFKADLRDGEVYARGAQDNKGQCFYVLLSLKALLARDGSLPMNVKLCIEGEEECGSAGLSLILQEKKESLTCNYLAIVDLGMESPSKPAITLGTRGLVSMDVEVKSTHTDLHSGSHGGLAFNPLHSLVKLLATLRDDSGKITIPHFYDDVEELKENDKAQISLHFDFQKYEQEFGATPSGGEQNYSPLERAWTRPTLEINGINGGYSGEGFKTVIPAKALAKISCRLVPNQDPEKIGALVANFLQSRASIGTKVTVHVHLGRGKAVRTDMNSKGVKAFAQAYEEIFQTPSDYIFTGASIPIVPALAEACRGEVVMVGLGLPTDCIHAPNEHFGIDRIEKGFLSIARAIEILAKNK